MSPGIQADICLHWLQYKVQYTQKQKEPIIITDAVYTVHSSVSDILHAQALNEPTLKTDHFRQWVRMKIIVFSHLYSIYIYRLNISTCLRCCLLYVQYISVVYLPLSFNKHATSSYVPNKCLIKLHFMSCQKERETLITYIQ